MQGTQLYDANSNPIYPSTYARNVDCGVVDSNNTVHDDISQIFTQLQALRRDITGGTSVQNNLGVIVTYATSSSNSASDAEGLSYSPTFRLPTSEDPYTWQKTEYYWGSDLVKTVYNIVATALYPETQVMYTSLPTIIGGSSNISGPNNYGTSVYDMTNNTVTWSNAFQGISPSTPYGYMAMRHRDAGEQFPVQDNHAVWNISLFAQYPIST